MTAFVATAVAFVANEKVLAGNPFVALPALVIRFGTFGGAMGCWAVGRPWLGVVSGQIIMVLFCAIVFVIVLVKKVAGL